MIPHEHLKDHPLRDMRVGEARKFDHVQCPAGADHRGRLSVLRKTDNLWLVYCYNCGDGNAVWFGGLQKSKESVLEVLRAHYAFGAPIIEDVMVNTTDKTALPDDATPSGEKWDAWAHERLWKHHTNVAHVVGHPYNWAFSTSLNQIITPIYGPDREVWGYQARQAPDIKPKCITTYYKGNNGKPLYYSGASADLFIVEDPLSALRINYDTGHHAVALLGTHLNEAAIVDLLKIVRDNRVRAITIWFDDDGAGREASVKVYARLSKLFPEPRFLVRKHTYLEPKQILDLKGRIREWTSHY